MDDGRFLDLNVHSKYLSSKKVAKKVRGGGRKKEKEKER